MIQNRLHDKEKEIQGLKKQSSSLLNRAWEKGYVAGFDDGYETGKQSVCGNNPKWCENCVSKGKCASTRLQGEWIEHYDNSDGFTWLTCSRCMYKAYEEDYNFCPNCGADMRKETENGN